VHPVQGAYSTSYIFFHGPRGQKTSVLNNPIIVSARAEAQAAGISTEEVWRQRESLYAHKRVATPREVAEMIAFLASEEPSGVGGQAISVALGGLT